MSSGPDRPSLSVCMIARDEAELLSQALESVRGLADEIVVVDTGSEDATVEVAVAHGARVSHMPWNNDFSEARNASLAMARGDWILILDADEVLDELAHDAVRTLMAAGPAAFVMVQRNYVKDSVYAGWAPNDERHPLTREWPGYVQATQIRLIPAGFGLEFVGAVHEDLTHSALDAGLEVRACDVPIHHFGKVRDDAVMARKKALYTQLGERKVEAAPHDPLALYELGVQYLELERRQESIALFQRCLAEDPPAYLDARATAFLGGMWADDGSPDRAIQTLEEGLVRHPHSLHLHETLCRVLLAAGRFTRALDALAAASQLFPRQAHLLRVRAGIQVELRQFGAAREELTRLLEMLGEDRGVQRTLRLVQMLESGRVDADAGRCGADARRRAEDIGWLVGALDGAGRTDLAMAFLARTGPECRRALIQLQLALEQRTAPETAGPSLVLAERHNLLSTSQLVAAAQALLKSGALAAGLHLADRGVRADHPASRVLRTALWPRLGCPHWARNSLPEMAVPAGT